MGTATTTDQFSVVSVDKCIYLILNNTVSVPNFGWNWFGYFCFNNVYLHLGNDQISYTGCWDPIWPTHKSLRPWDMRFLMQNNMGNNVY